MTSEPTYTLRPATHADAETLGRLAALDSARPVRGEALVGEVDGHPVAALELATGRVTADPFARTAGVVALMRRATAGDRGTVRQPTFRRLVFAGGRRSPQAA